MWQWINDNSGALSVFTSIGTLLVWLFYAHLLLSGFRRQRKARVLVNQGWGSQIDSVCLVSNMSQEAIFIQCIVLTLHTAQGNYSSSITDLEQTDESPDTGPLSHITRQGPLVSGSYMNLGTFRSLIRQVARRCGLSDDGERPIAMLQLHSVTVTVISSYGPEHGAIGSQRNFLIRGEDNDLMRPATTTTERLKHKDANRELERWIESLV